MPLKTKKIIDFIEELTPPKYAYEWDNVGLLIGEKDQEVKKIMVALDATENVVDEAVKNKVDLLITHHPMVFKGVKRITTDDFLGRKILKLIRHNISLYAAHTNLDAVGSLSDLLSKKLKLQNIELLDTKETEKLYKLVVFTPITHGDNVREAICNVGAGHIGNYSHCTYNIQGEGTFKPLEGTNPYIGEQGQLEKVEEIRIETIVKEKDMPKVIKSLLEAHPYEEVAYDIYPLENRGEAIGIGRLGSLPTNMTIEEFGRLIKKQLGIGSVRIYGDLNQSIEKVAVCPGKGASYIKNAMRKNADIIVTGDIDYHTAIDTLQEGLPLIDAGHFGTEHIIVDFLIDLLRDAFLNDNKDLEIIRSQEKNPYITI
ncbi:dinuclear metal center YbgI/SA1388 family protein [Natranaerovirga pectinivora]|uniref:GTP cyclohydrolase 1 type 2 homolog n=1 Tax=Natranaerovirga pectinivora TaxID=682400 RepID=A0A4R3MS03_9FIRM|nr:Nif3-like dinuclear metal center hexameric protein [Natranaerovirga pectinivora]TCT15577.1 dinuclear metal center YbgI/SA1388 family protein [Natranaerovirga pectinivora]